MSSATTRHRVLIIGMWTLLSAAFIGWVVSLALEAPWVPWFTVALWGTIGIGLVVRTVRGATRTREPLDAFREVNQTLLGQTHTPPLDDPNQKSAEIGSPFPESDRN